MKIKIQVREYLGGTGVSGKGKFGPSKILTIDTDKTPLEVLESIANLFNVEIKGVGRPRKKKNEKKG